MAEIPDHVQCNAECNACCIELNIMKGNLKPYRVVVETIVMAPDECQALEIAMGKDSNIVPLMEEAIGTGLVTEVVDGNATVIDLMTPPWGQPDSKHLIEVKDMFEMRRKYREAFEKKDPANDK